MIPQLRKLAWVLPVGLLLAPVVAEAGNVSNVIFRIDATSTVGSATWSSRRTSWSTSRPRISGPGRRASMKS